MSDKNNTCCGYPVHEAAALFPLMSEPELKELAEDIKTNGLIYPVIMCDDKILDGRNRLLACEIAEVGVRFRDFRTYKSEHTPTEWVLATNLKRRQLTPSQRGTIGAEAKEFIAKEVLEQKRKRLSAVRSSQIPTKLSESEEDSREARARAAKVARVSQGYITAAEQIKEKSPEVFAQVRAGSKTISVAKKELGLEPASQEPDPLAVGKREWLKYSAKQQTEFLAWTRKHRK